MDGKNIFSGGFLGLDNIGVFDRSKPLPVGGGFLAQVSLFVCFVALRPKSTAMVMAGWSVHLTTLFSWASLNKRSTSSLCTYFACN